MRYSLYSFISKIVDLVFAVVGTIVGLRILFKLFAASSGAPIVNWIYSVSNGFIAPFQGLLPDVPLAANSYFDVTALIAIAFYMLAAALIERILAAAFHEDSYTVRDHVHV